MMRVPKVRQVKSFYVIRREKTNAIIALFVSPSLVPQNLIWPVPVTTHHNNRESARITGIEDLAKKQEKYPNHFMNLLQILGLFICSEFRIKW